MVDENPIKKYIKIFKIIIAVIVITIIIMTIFNKIMTTININNFTTYLKENGYEEKSDGSYYKYKKNDEKKISYKALDETFVISKIIETEVNYNYTDIILKYKNNGNIEIELQYEGKNEAEDYGLLYQTGNYKNGKFDCKIISGKNFASQCNLMKEEAKIFENEIKKIIDNYKINTKYIVK